MTTVQPTPTSFWNDTGKTGITSWIFSTDHKRIGLLYFYSTFGFFLVGVLSGALAAYRTDGAGAHHHGACRPTMPCSPCTGW